MPLSIPEECAKEPFGRRLIATTLDQDIEKIALLIDRPPEIVPLAVNRKKYLVQMLLVTRPRVLATQLVRVCSTKFATPSTEGIEDMHFSQNQESRLDRPQWGG